MKTFPKNVWKKIVYKMWIVPVENNNNINKRLSPNLKNK